MATWEDLFSKKHYRRLLLGSSLLAAITLISIRFALIPWIFKQPYQGLFSILNAIIDNLFVALVSSFITTFLVLWFFPTASKGDASNIVESYALKEVLKKSLEQTTEFSYSGHTARWTCAKTLPFIASEANSRARTIKVYLTILDPSNKVSCKRYAVLRNRIRIETDRPEVLRKIHQLELFSTIVSAYSWRVQEPRLDIEVGLSDKVSIFRVDLSSKAAIVTTPGAGRPALKFDVESSFYNLFYEDVTLAHSQSRILRKKKHDVLLGVPFSELNPTNVRELLEDLELDVSDLNNADFEEITRKALKRENPYPA